MNIYIARDKAIENGWDKGKSFTAFCTAETDWCEHMVMDVNFWIALGKALNWEKEPRKNFEGMSLTNRNSWFYHWKKLINHLADGGSIESYFAELK